MPAAKFIPRGIDGLQSSDPFPVSMTDTIAGSVPLAPLSVHPG